jgi:hypothetical protein
MKKLKPVIDFPESANLEVEYSVGMWARVTARHFRSFTGSRRVNGEPYIGLVFYEGTNYPYEVRKKDTNRIVSIEELNKKRKREARNKKLKKKKKV